MRQLSIYEKAGALGAGVSFAIGVACIGGSKLIAVQESQLREVSNALENSHLYSQSAIFDQHVDFKASQSDRVSDVGITALQIGTGVLLMTGVSVVHKNHFNFLA